jgi:hypothetical protein
LLSPETAYSPESLLGRHEVKIVQVNLEKTILPDTTTNYVPIVIKNQMFVVEQLFVRLSTQQTKIEAITSIIYSRQYDGNMFR